MSTKFIAKTILTEDGDLDSVFFDATLIVSNDNEIVVVDNLQNDYHDFIDANTLTIKKIKIEV
tara:strand:- start:3291 stop:3479 length:189 start_codon:yes stop_codon:yes gene_type:complete